MKNITISNKHYEILNNILNDTDDTINTIDDVIEMLLSDARESNYSFINTYGKGER